MIKIFILVICAAILSFSSPPISYSAGDLGDRCLRDEECNSGECRKFQCVEKMKPKGDIGDRCLRDEECISGECKKFQCVEKIKPKGDIGDRCFFDEDCKSDECKKLRCVENEYKILHKNE